MTEHWTIEQYKEHIANKGKKHPQRPKSQSAYRSNLERDYANYLELSRMCGQIKSWAHEPDKFPITDGAKPVMYIPDFKVVSNDGRIEYHETKFVRTGKGKKLKQAKEGLLKLKIAADKYPENDWYLVERIQGRWVRTQIGG